MGAVSILAGILTVLLWILGVAAGLLLLIVAAVLFLPLDFSGRVEAHLAADEDSDTGYTGTAGWRAFVRWAWGVVSMRAEGEGTCLMVLQLRICGLRIPLGQRSKKAASAPEQSGSKPKKPKRAKKPKKQRKRAPTWEEIQVYITEGWRFLRRLWAAMRLRLRGDVTFGLDDPAETGLMLARLYMLGIPGHNLRIQADFVYPRLDGWL
ncbi:MAG TPA: hypothetical protein VD902_20795, partial [Symbiobacteriaceae bacterium]|nr:hypothetical protein [Symbiobacteriaceae bacterium]